MWELILSIPERIMARLKARRALRAEQDVREGEALAEEAKANDDAIAAAQAAFEKSKGGG